MKGMTTMTPNLERAAAAAAETLIRYNITSAPVDPLPILKKYKNVLVLSYTEMSYRTGIDRDNLVTMYGAENQDAVTLVRQMDNHLMYFVAYNQRLPFYMLQRALARELGHIVLGHDGSRPDDVRMAEAVCFARHFLCPRPLIKSLMDADKRITSELIGNVTGCYERCLAGIKKTPGTHVPGELNRKVREQFADYVRNFLSYEAIAQYKDGSAEVDFGTYMDYYTEE